LLAGYTERLKENNMLKFFEIVLCIFSAAYVFCMGIAFVAMIIGLADMAIRKFLKK